MLMSGLPLSDLNKETTYFLTYQFYSNVYSLHRMNYSREKRRQRAHHATMVTVENGESVSTEHLVDSRQSAVFICKQSSS